MVSINCLISQQNTGLTHTHPPHCVWSRPTNCRTVASYTCTLASFSPATGISLDWYNHSRPSVHHLHVLIPSLPPKRQTRLPLLPSLNLNLGCHNRDSKEYNFYAIIQNKRTYLLVPFCFLDRPSLSNRERLSEWIKQFLKRQTITIMLWHAHCTHLHSDKSTLSVFIEAPPIQCLKPLPWLSAHRAFENKCRWVSLRHQARLTLLRVVHHVHPSLRCCRPLD